METIYEVNPILRFDPRGGRNRYKCNFDFFKQWTDGMAYVLGFLYADGDIVDAVSSRTQYIKFVNTDKEIIEKIKTAMRSEHPISVRAPQVHIYKNGAHKSRELFILRIGSRGMFHDLIHLGIVPNKSKIITFPNVPLSYLSHFIRGYFDGDGSIVFNKKWIRIVFTSGSKDFLDQLSDELSRALEIRKRSVRLGHHSYQLYYFTQEGLKVLNFIYKNVEKDKLYLDRKYKFYKKLAVKYKYILNKHITQVAVYPSSLRGRSAKPLFVGANPTAASKFCRGAGIGLQE